MLINEGNQGQHLNLLTKCHICHTSTGWISPVTGMCLPCLQASGLAEPLFLDAQELNAHERN